MTSSLERTMGRPLPKPLDSRHRDQIGGFSIGKMLLWPGERRFQQTDIPKSLGPTIQRE